MLDWIWATSNCSQICSPSKPGKDAELIERILNLRGYIYIHRHVHMSVYLIVYMYSVYCIICVWIQMLQYNFSVYCMLYMYIDTDVAVSHTTSHFTSLQWLHSNHHKSHNIYMCIHAKRLPLATSYSIFKSLFPLYVFVKVGKRMQTK